LTEKDRKEAKQEEKLEKERSDYSQRFVVLDETLAPPAAMIFNAEADAEDHVDKIIEERSAQGEFVADKLYVVKLPKPLREKVAKEHDKAVQKERDELFAPHQEALKKKK